MAWGDWGDPSGILTWVLLEYCTVNIQFLLNWRIRGIFASFGESDFIRIPYAASQMDSFSGLWYAISQVEGREGCDFGCNEQGSDLAS